MEFSSLDAHQEQSLVVAKRTPHASSLINLSHPINQGFCFVGKVSTDFGSLYRDMKPDVAEVPWDTLHVVGKLAIQNMYVMRFSTHLATDFAVGPVGAGYLVYRLKPHLPAKPFMKAWRDGDTTMVQHMVSQAYKASGIKATDKFIFLSYEEELVSILTERSPFHMDVFLQQLVLDLAAPIIHLDAWLWRPLDYSLRLFVDFPSVPGFAYGTLIENGETGHKRLKIYECAWPKHTRYPSRVGQLTIRKALTVKKQIFSIRHASNKIDMVALTYEIKENLRKGDMARKLKKSQAIPGTWAHGRLLELLSRVKAPKTTIDKLELKLPGWNTTTRHSHSLDVIRSSLDCGAAHGSKTSQAIIKAVEILLLEELEEEHKKHEFKTVSRS